MTQPDFENDKVEDLLRSAAALHGQSSSEERDCPFWSGTIFYDDWHDGFRARKTQD